MIADGIAGARPMMDYTLWIFV